MKEDKTNVIRLFEQNRVDHKLRTYDPDPTMSGGEIAALLGEDSDKVFKTLVTQGRSGRYYVFVIPVNEELDLKKAAKAVNEKSVSMIKQKDLLPLTGYVHGGCSPIGMKKQFPTFFHDSIKDLERIYFSAGKVGYQVETAVSDLKAMLVYNITDLTVQD